MTSEMWAGLAMATGIWLVFAGALVSAPADLPKEVWVSTSSDRVRSHPTLVRAADPIMTGAILAKGKGEHLGAQAF
jgi:hypothetical protein